MIMRQSGKKWLRQKNNYYKTWKKENQVAAAWTLGQLEISIGEIGLHDRADFMDMFQKQISDMRLLGQQKLAAYYKYSMQVYWNFMNKK